MQRSPAQACGACNGPLTLCSRGCVLALRTAPRSGALSLKVTAPAGAGQACPDKQYLRDVNVQRRLGGGEALDFYHQQKPLCVAIWHIEKYVEGVVKMPQSAAV
jgi:hypothetical protein